MEKRTSLFVEHRCLFAAEMNDNGCIHLNNFKAAKGTNPYKIVHAFFVSCTSYEARRYKVNYGQISRVLYPIDFSERRNTYGGHHNIAQFVFKEYLHLVIWGDCILNCYKQNCIIGSQLLSAINKNNQLTDLWPQDSCLCESRN